LFPSNPSLTAATFDGVYLPKISPDGRKIAFGVQSEDKKGIWLLELRDRQFFFSSKNQRKILTDTDTHTFSASTFTWAPTSNTLLIESKNNNTDQTDVFEIEQAKLNTNPKNVTNLASTLKQGWQNSTAQTNLEKLAKLGSEAESLNQDVAQMLFSEDNSAVILVKNDQSAVVYDTKPSPVPNVKPLIVNLPVAQKYFWFQDGTKHIAVIENNGINLMDTDGTNKASIFTGDFDPNAAFSWPDGTKLILGLNLNSRSNPLPNLYTIDLQ
jgi:hypothetical protein